MGAPQDKGGSLGPSARLIGETGGLGAAAERMPSDARRDAAISLAKLLARDLARIHHGGSLMNELEPD